MTPEWMAVILSAATLLVVAAGAVAALIQLRHLRTSNQLAALLEILEQWNEPAVQRAYFELNTRLESKLEDEAYVGLLRAGAGVDRMTHQEFLVFDFWEQVGTYVKRGLIDEATLLDVASSQVLRTWRRARPVVEIIRDIRKSRAPLENFEYLAARALLWERRYPDGSYPASTPRMADLEPPPASRPPSAETQTA